MNKIGVSSYSTIQYYHFSTTILYRLVIYKPKLAHKRTSTKRKCMYIACLCSCLCLQHRRCAIEYLFFVLFKCKYQSFSPLVPPNHFPHCEKYRIFSSVPLSCVPPVISVQKGSLILYFSTKFCWSLLTLFP